METYLSREENDVQCWMEVENKCWMSRKEREKKKKKNLSQLFPFSVNMTSRLYPNIIITGTPGCGKTSHCESLVESLNDELRSHFQHLEISKVARERGCIDGFDQERDSSIVDEDKLVDSLEPDLREGGKIIDWHCCDVFPERLIDLVVVVTCDNSVLFDRLSQRGYPDSKITENIDCEIMQVILQEAKDSYAPEIVIELSSEDLETMDDNVERIIQWINSWRENNPDGASNELD